jgi:hypothetical protein
MRNKSRDKLGIGIRERIPHLPLWMDGWMDGWMGGVRVKKKGMLADNFKSASLDWTLPFLHLAIGIGSDMVRWTVPNSNKKLVTWCAAWSSNKNFRHEDTTHYALQRRHHISQEQESSEKDARFSSEEGRKAYTKRLQRRIPTNSEAYDHPSTKSFHLNQQPPRGLYKSN